MSITGWALLFHPDLLHGFPLERHIRGYSFFDYRVNEALHMTDEEHDIMVSLMRQIREELDKRPDGLQQAIIVGYIELALNFCQRFYNRQFITRKIENSDILVRFDSLLRSYFEDELQLSHGLPTVQYCADKLCMSANYFGDVIKKTTGDTAGNHIRRFVIQLAKNGLASGESVSQARLRIHPAFQPYVQKIRGYHSVGIPPTPPFPLSSPLKSMLQREHHSHIAFAQCNLQLCLRDIVYLSQAGKVPRVGVVIDDEVVPLVED